MRVVQSGRPVSGTMRRWHSGHLWGGCAGIVVVIGLVALAARAADEAPNPERPAATAAAPSGSGQYDLADYGPIKTPAEAKAALDKALADVVAKGGGVLVVPPGAPADWQFENEAPSSTLHDVPTVTILDRRSGYERTLVPSNGKLSGVHWAGQHLERNVRQNVDRVFGVLSTQVINTNIAGGTASYIQPSLEPVKAGNDVRVYVPTIRGLYAGMHVNFHTGPPRGFGAPSDTTPVKSIGWDAQRRQNFVVLDLKLDHPAESLLSNKHVVNSLSIQENSNSDNQSMALQVTRNLYGMGDAFGIHSTIRNQGNVMSAAGDEGGLTFGSDIFNDVNPFHSTVESVDWQRQELVYAPGNVQNHTLGTSRPLVNLNPKKWVTAGTVQIVAPGHPDPAAAAEAGGAPPVFAYGAIIGSKDAGWTPEVVGRFFAVDEPSEYLDPANDSSAGYTNPPTKRVYRWYQIQKLEDRPDGTKRLFVERTFWWTRNDAAPKLYDFANYTVPGHDRPVKYVIAPGAYVTDVSRAWTNAEVRGGSVDATSPRTLKLAPGGDAGTPFDFAKGDEVTQAIGQDPWNPTGLRVRHHNYLPTTIGDHSFQAMNLGRVTVDAAISVGGGSSGDLDADVKASKDKQPLFLRVISIDASAGTGIRFGGDVRDAAISFEQPRGKPQPISWRLTAQSQPPHTLTVDPQKGGFEFRGNGIVLPQGGIVLPQGGISAGDKPASNLRGIGVAVPADAREVKVVFARPEPDGNYAVTVQPDWITQDAVTEKTPEGFTVQFGAAPAKEGKIDWIMVR